MCRYCNDEWIDLRSDETFVQYGGVQPFYVAVPTVKIPWVTFVSVVAVVAGGPLQGVGGNGREEVPNGPWDNHIVEEGQENTNTHYSLKIKQI